mmetsp:Transcript_13302/g.29333  ORF Transcript_13302/g.29333 Transcript_13302/m.29333 type:complete len:384 (+) Transcript_13302:88-1239(+)
MLGREDYIGVISSCGPVYVRGIRRTAEVLTHFTFVSLDVTLNKEISLAFKQDVNGIKNSDNVKKGSQSANNKKKKTSFFASSKNMIITVQGWGLDMSSMEDGDSLIPRSMDDYDLVISSAFKMMTNSRTGIIQSIEVVPWDTNAQFQQGLNMDSVIMYPNGRFPTFLKQMYFSNNSEHIVKLEQISRFKFNMIQSLSQCMKILWGMPASERCHSFVRHRKYEYTNSDKEDMQVHLRGKNLGVFNLADTYSWQQTGAEQYLISAERLKWLLDGMNEDAHQDFLLQTVTNHHRDWMNYYFGPCLKKLSSSRYGIQGGMLFTSHWMEHDECNKITCLMETAYWDSDKCTLVQPTRTDWITLTQSFCMPEIGGTSEDTYWGTSRNCT